MTTLTHVLLDGAGQPQVGVPVTLSVYDGNRYATGSRWQSVATSGAGGALTWTIPDSIHFNRRGTYFRLTGSSITAPPVVMIKPGTVSTTVAQTLVGSSDSSGKMPDRSGPPGALAVYATADPAVADAYPEHVWVVMGAHGDVQITNTLP